MEYPASSAGQSVFKPANFTALPRLSVSSAMSVPILEGEPASASMAEPDLLPFLVSTAKAGDCVRSLAKVFGRAEGAKWGL